MIQLLRREKKLYRYLHLYHHLPRLHHQHREKRMNKFEFYPCKKFKDLDKRYKKSFHYCRANIHLLPYYPKRYTSPSSTAALKIGKFIKDNGIDLILYKGGCIKEQICKELYISSFNIEKLGKFENFISMIRMLKLILITNS